jgi:hypothetical protein
VSVRPRRRRAGLLVALLTAALGLAACTSDRSGLTTTTTGSGTAPTTSSTTTGCANAASAQSTSASGSGTTVAATAAGTSRLVWILSRSALADVEVDPAALAVLERGTIYEILGARQRPVAGVDAVITEDFESYAGMSAAVQDGQLVAGAGAVLYDPEDWQYTPLCEQVDLPSYIGDAVHLAHSHGLKIIVTPALDLVDTLYPGTPADEQVAKFLSSGIEQAAAGADIVDVQAQGREHDTSSYASFVLQAAAAIHARRPGAIVVAGLSTNPPSGGVTAGVLAAAIEAVRGHVQGFWLNVPSKGGHCPGCSSNPDPQAGTGALVAAFG